VPGNKIAEVSLVQFKMSWKLKISRVRRKLTVTKNPQKVSQVISTEICPMVTCV
jgi:hypothetical protein